MKRQGLLLLVPALAVLTGCLGVSAFDKSPEAAYYYQDFRGGKLEWEHMEAGGVAIGGVVARAGVILKPESAADTALVDPDHWNAEWVHPVEWKFRAAFPSLPLRGFREFEFRVSHDLVESAWSEYAHGGYMSSGILGKFEESGPGARFLLLVRVESDDVSQDLISGSTRVSNESGIKNRVGNAQSSLDMEPTFIRIDLVRKVGLTASLFDLEAGACVWEDRVVAESTIRIDPESHPAYGDLDIHRTEDGQVILDGGDQPEPPAYSKAYEKGLDTLLYRLNDSINEPDQWESLSDEGL